MSLLDPSVVTEVLPNCMYIVSVMLSGTYTHASTHQITYALASRNVTYQGRPKWHPQGPRPSTHEVKNTLKHLKLYCAAFVIQFVFLNDMISCRGISSAATMECNRENISTKKYKISGFSVHISSLCSHFLIHMWHPYWDKSSVGPRNALTVHIVLHNTSFSFLSWQEQQATRWIYFSLKLNFEWIHYITYIATTENACKTQNHTNELNVSAWKVIHSTTFNIWEQMFNVTSLFCMVHGWGVWVDSALNKFLFWLLSFDAWNFFFTSFEVKILTHNSWNQHNQAVILLNITMETIAGAAVGRRRR